MEDLIDNMIDAAQLGDLAFKEHDFDEALKVTRSKILTKTELAREISAAANAILSRKIGVSGPKLFSHKRQLTNQITGEKYWSFSPWKKSKGKATHEGVVVGVREIK